MTIAIPNWATASFSMWSWAHSGGGLTDVWTRRRGQLMIHGGPTGAGHSGHVNIDLGDGTVVEAANTRLGVVHRNVYGLGSFMTAAVDLRHFGATSADIEQMIGYALHQVGKPYGTSNPGRFGPQFYDCSGLVYSAIQYANHTPDGPQSKPPDISGALQFIHDASQSVLAEGAHGPYVILMQSCLMNKHFSCGASGADGAFGPNTKSALMGFQHQVGIVVDGVCGPVSWAHLLA